MSNPEPSEPMEMSRRLLLSADDLIDLRKSVENPTMQSVGQKGYNPSGDLSEAEQVALLLADRQKLLEQHRASCIGGLVQGMWNEEMHRAVVYKLKGKFTQHMGQMVDGNVTLSPEESVFLLENGLLELTHCGMPMSTEEAYSIVLKKKLGIEKYQVYSHLSRLGYVVVSHQENLDEMEGWDSGKRQMYEDAEYSRPNKRIAVSLADSEVTSVQNREAMMENNEADARVYNSPERNGYVPEDVPVELNRDPFDFGVNYPEVEVNVDVNVDGPLEEDVAPPAAVLWNDQEELPPRPAEDRADDANGEPHDEVVPVEAAREELPARENDDNNNVEENGAGTSGAELRQAEQNNQGSSSQSDYSSLMGTYRAYRIHNKNKDTTTTTTTTTISSNIQDDGATSDSDSSSSCGSSGSSSSSSSSSIEDDANPDDTRDSVESVGVNNNNNGAGANAADENDDIVFVEVTKTEKQPLAVIDLLSDDDEDVRNGNQSQGESSNDDVQIIAECPSSSSTMSRQRRRKRFKPARMNTNFKKEMLDYPKAEVDPEFNSSVKWPFPNLLRKSVVCLARPPPHLLPRNVRLAKEAYTMDIKMLTKTSDNPKPRLWNSYKDLQERRNYHQHSSRSQWNRPFSPNFSSSDTYGMQGPNQSHSSNNHAYNNNNNGPPSPSPFNMLAGGAPNPIPHHGQNFPSHMQPSDQHRISEFIKHAQRTAMHVAQTVLNQMTMNLPFPVPAMPQMYPGVNGQNYMANYNYPGNGAYPHPEQIHRMADNARNAFSPSAPYPQLPYPSGRPDRGARDQQMTNTRNYRFPPWRGSRDSDSKGMPPYPSCIPRVQVSSKTWSEFKSTIGDAPGEEDDDILEVAVSEDDVLWFKKLTPLVSLGVQNIEEASKALSLTKRINIVSDAFCYRYISDLEITFDVYLPGSNFRKTRPTVPNYRIVVLRVTDSFPKMLDMIKLQYKFDDSATLQFAIVDDGSVAFYSFNSLNIPDYLPI